MHRFENDEFGYRDWVHHCRHGFVLNYRAGTRQPDDLTLHSAKCGDIMAPRPDGSSSTVDYGKACSEDRGELEALARQWGGVAKLHYCVQGGSV